MNYVYIQGNLAPAKKATIALDNRGFKFGDGVFETMRIYNFKPYNFQFHLKRLLFGLSYLQIKLDTSELENLVLNLTKKNKLKNGFARIFVYRDSPSKGYKPISNQGAFLIESFAHTNEDPLNPKLYVSNFTSTCTSGAKTLSSLNYVMSMLEAKDNDCENTLILNDREYITETASGNIFWLKDGVLYTPGEEVKFISGSIRERVLALYQGDTVTGKFTLNDITNANEIFMTNVNHLVLPFVNLQPLGREYSIEKSLEIKQLIEDDIAISLG